MKLFCVRGAQSYELLCESDRSNSFQDSQAISPLRHRYIAYLIRNEFMYHAGEGSLIHKCQMNGAIDRDSSGKEVRESFWRK